MEQEKRSSLIVSMADVPERDAEWLIPEYIPKGQISLISGDGGAGKSTIWCAIAAAISTGNKAFFEPVPEEFAGRKPGKVLFFSSEDSLEYTLRARLRKAGADLKNIFSVSLRDERFCEIKFNSKILKDLIEEVKPELVIFDPLQAFLPPDIQMGQRNAMRHCLNPLISMGEQYGTTFIIICHTNKRQGTYGRNRVADSADVWDIARSVLICGETSDKMRYLTHEKSNYGELGQTVLFTISDGVAVFEGYSDQKDIDFVRARDQQLYQAPQRQDAEQFVIDYLRHGKKPTRELDEACTAAGISKKTLERAKTSLRKKKILAGKSEGYGQGKVFYSFLLDNDFS